MTFSIDLLLGEKIYHGEVKEGEKITFGSGKKDNIQVPELQTSHVMVKQTLKGVFVTSKVPYQVSNKELKENALTILSMEHRVGLYLCEATGTSAEKVKLPYNCKVKIGRSKKNDVSISNPYISGEHLVIRSESGIIRVEDNDSTNGIYLNGSKISQARLRSGDVISLLGARIHLINGILHFENVGHTLHIHSLPQDSSDYDVNLKEEEKKAPTFRRSPRTMDQLPTDAITLANPPSKGQKFEKSRGIFASLLGTGSMFAASMTMGAASPAFMAARAASLVTPVASLGSQSSGNKRRKKKLEQYEQLRKERYGQYIQEQKARIEAVATEQREILTKENPEPEECMRMVFDVNRKLWERNDGDRDYLDVRMGMGYEPLCVPVKSFVNENSFEMEEDEIRKMAEMIIEETRIVDYVPSRLRMGQFSTIGFIGERKKVIHEVRNIIVSLTSSHFYQDVKIVGLFDESEEEIWKPLRWLPHNWDDNRDMRFLAFQKEDTHRICELLQNALEARKRRLSDRSFGNIVRPKPHYIFVLGSKKYMEDEAIMKYLLLNHPEMGVTSLFLFDNMYSLPHGCQFIVDLNQEPSGYETDKMNQRFIFTMDKDITTGDFDRYTRAMAAIQVEGFAKITEIPEAVTFLQGYHVKQVEDLEIFSRWRKNCSHETLAAPIGQIAGGKTFFLDIDEKAHGPHGLVAGTTGSGKSELLITWILSMAINYHPYDVAFVLIDYKGGGMANVLEPLPHVVGKITNIGSNINRSLISLQSEQKRRMFLFDKYTNITGVNISNINTYQKLYKNGRIKEPLPHLIIVADEFAELKRDEPEFMSALVSIARVGRSLGIHLILATQKPSGVVDDQIWANSQFRLCLKVQSAADSREMLKKPDAASITRPGRLYVQVGEDEIYKLVQSYWSGAPYYGENEKKKEDENQIKLVKISGQRYSVVKKEKKKQQTDLDEVAVITGYILKTAQKMGIVKLDGPWLPELSQYLPLQKLLNSEAYNNGKWGTRQKWLRIPVGMYDDPASQRQGIQYIDFHEMGHLGIYGAPGTGKTTLLKTIFMSIGMNYTPQDVQIYAIDCGGWSTSEFAEMPHVGDIALSCEQEKIGKLQKLFWDELDFRKNLLLKNHVSSLAAYRRTIGSDIPALVLGIDNLPAVFELFPDIENLLITLSGEGAAYGIYLVFTSSSTSGIRFKFQQNIKSAVAFELTDKGDYPSLVGRLDGLSLPNIRGRALMKGTPPLLFQTAIYMDGENELERTCRLKLVLEEMDDSWTGIRPKVIPIMPSVLSEHELTKQYELRTQLPLGVSYENIKTCKVDMTERYALIISGTVQSGKSRRIQEIIRRIHEKQPEDKIYIFDGTKKSLAEVESMACQYGIYSDKNKMKQMLGEIIDMLNARKNAQNRARAVSPDVFNEAEFIQKTEQICIFIDDLKEFVDEIENDIRDSMERICRLAQHLGVLVFAACRVTDLEKYNAIESLTRVLVANQHALVLSGNAYMYSMFDNNLPFQEKNMDLDEGDAYFYNSGNCTKIKLSDH